MNIIDDFIAFLIKQWSENPDYSHAIESPEIMSGGLLINGLLEYKNGPWHLYPISSHNCWRSWKDGGNETPSLELPRPARDNFWWCTSLREASQHYSWTESEHGNFGSLSASLRAQMNVCNERNSARLCHQILDWGGVGRRPDNSSRKWINDQEAAGTLINALSCAVSHLQPTSDALASFCFDGNELPMNSATTKLFAAADPTNSTLIFDGRVGAALCLLVRRFMEGRLCTMPLPDELLFYWGPHQTKPNIRNPSSPLFKFRNINQVSNLARAQASKRANIIARQLYLSAGVAPSDFEQALFMIGYSVNS